MTAFEDFVAEEATTARSILGLYPPTDPRTPGGFAAWRQAKGPGGGSLTARNSARP